MAYKELIGFVPRECCVEWADWCRGGCDDPITEGEGNSGALGQHAAAPVIGGPRCLCGECDGHAGAQSDSLLHHW